MGEMLRQRIITGLILAGALLATLAYAPHPLQALLFALVAAAGAWEWAGLVGAKTAAQRAGFAMVVPLLCFLLWQRIGLADQQPAIEAQPWLAVSAFFWSAMLLALKYYPSGSWLLKQTWVRAVMGWLILSGTWLAVAVCLTFDNGPMVMLMMILTVAAADIGAYFVGRRFGRHALAKEISPGKTWEGFWGGMLAVTALTLSVWQSLPPAYLHLGFGSILALGLATAGASVVGDLTVSLLKREMGMKDTGSWLPGHGGVLDRLDSICGAAPIFALGLLLVGY